MSEIIKKVLGKIVPRAEQKQKIEETANAVLKKARKECPEEVEAMLVGSVAKGTFLADVDIDVFLRFPIDFLWLFDRFSNSFRLFSKVFD